MENKPESSDTPSTAAQTPAPAPVVPAVPAAGSPAPAQIRRRPPQPSGPPLYRIVEMMRDGEGRLRKEGRVWHPDIDLARRFGRAVASNSTAAKVLITDASGEVLETLSVAPLGERQAVWEGWRDIPLPPRPKRKKPRYVPRLPSQQAVASAEAEPAAPDVAVLLP